MVVRPGLQGRQVQGMSSYLEGVTPCARRTCQGLLDFQHVHHQVHDVHDVAREHMLQSAMFRTAVIEAPANVVAVDSSESQAIFVAGAVPVAADVERQLE
jgi:hypothetical protein